MVLKQKVTQRFGSPGNLALGLYETVSFGLQITSNLIPNPRRRAAACVQRSFSVDGDGPVQSGSTLPSDGLIETHNETSQNKRSGGHLGRLWAFHSSTRRNYDGNLTLTYKILEFPLKFKVLWFI